MPYAEICFQVPENHQKVAELIDGWAGESSELGTPLEDAANGLALNVGQVVTVSFDDEEPIHPIHDLAAELRQQGAKYLGVFDAMVERSRGLRVEGRALYNMTGQPEHSRELTIPWTFGRPAIDERTLRAGGLSSEDAQAVIEALLSNEAKSHPVSQL